MTLGGTTDLFYSMVNLVAYAFGGGGLNENRKMDRIFMFVKIIWPQGDV